VRISPGRALALAVLTGIIAGPLGPVAARADEEDLSELRELRERGEILSLEEVIERVRGRYPEAHLVEAEVDREGGRLIYEVELIDADGVVRELFFDARSGDPVTDFVEEGESH